MFDEIFKKMISKLSINHLEIYIYFFTSLFFWHILDKSLITKYLNIIPKNVVQLLSEIIYLPVKYFLYIASFLIILITSIYTYIYIYERVSKNKDKTSFPIQSLSHNLEFFGGSHTFTSNLLTKIRNYSINYFVIYFFFTVFFIESKPISWSTFSDNPLVTLLGIYVTYVFFRYIFQSLYYSEAEYYPDYIEQNKFGAFSVIKKVNLSNSRKDKVIMAVAPNYYKIKYYVLTEIYEKPETYYEVIFASNSLQDTLSIYKEYTSSSAT